MRAIGELDAPHLVEVLHSISEPFAVFDRDLRLVFLNRAAATLIGSDADAVVGKHASELSADPHSPTLDAYRRVLATREPMTLEFQVPRDHRWFESHVAPLSNGISVLSRDVTGRRHAADLARRMATHATLRADVSAALADERDISARCSAAAKQR